MSGVFLGTPAAAIPSLTAFADVEDVDLVITQPDRRAGRGGSKVSSPVKVAARQFGFKVAQPATSEELLSVLEEYRPTIGLVVAYGRLLAPEVLGLVPYGLLNVHFSLLPRWRGAAPVERAIAAGDVRTGVTLMKIDEGLDTGPILDEIATPIAPDETGGSLSARLAFLGAALVDRATPEYLNDRRRPVPQLSTGASRAAKLTKDSARLRPSWDPSQAERSIRAFTPRPGAWIHTAVGDVKVHRAQPSTDEMDEGMIAVIGGNVLAGFSGGALELLVVQPPGKESQDARDWMNGRRGEPLAFVEDAG
ncbi:MAG: methionyl-tRNA formyltransferase [Actinomycetota bacterium]